MEKTITEPPKVLVVTADDFGIRPEINAGIIEGYKDGIITAAALLVNAVATNEAVQLIEENPNLEVGLHLSIVEGYSLSGGKSLLDRKEYFPGRPCLHRHWTVFLVAYLRGHILKVELENEMRAQIEAFLRIGGSIPFLNSTQHLHLLPGIHDVILSLCEEYKIPWIRMLISGEKMTFSIRGVQMEILRRFGKKLANRAQCSNIALSFPDVFLGFEEGGTLSEEKLLKLIDQVKPGITELMTHPGRESSFLRTRLRGYKNFSWESELRALISPAVINRIKERNIRLCGFSEAIRLQSTWRG
jgi:predicted glycoside hydrolase/deacetylase ChbG (UPF0249 family)